MHLDESSSFKEPAKYYTNVPRKNQEPKPRSTPLKDCSKSLGREASQKEVMNNESQVYMHPYTRTFAFITMIYKLFGICRRFDVLFDQNTWISTIKRI
jgi:hypothetical protein